MTAEERILQWLEHADFDNTGCRHSQDTIARAIGCSREHINRCVKTLAANGRIRIEKERRPGLKWPCNVYHLENWNPHKRSGVLNVLASIREARKAQCHTERTAKPSRAQPPPELPSPRCNSKALVAREAQKSAEATPLSFRRDILGVRKLKIRRVWADQLLNPEGPRPDRQGIRADAGIPDYSEQPGKLNIRNELAVNASQQPELSSDLEDFCGSACSVPSHVLPSLNALLLAAFATSGPLKLPSNPLKVLDSRLQPQILSLSSHHHPQRLNLPRAGLLNARIRLCFRAAKEPARNRRPNPLTRHH